MCFRAWLAAGLQSCNGAGSDSNEVPYSPQRHGIGDVCIEMDRMVNLGDFCIEKNGSESQKN
jgi:hypothetical protein